MPLVSVLIPTHNRADYFLPRAVESVLNQTCKDFELIIGDNASEDNTKEVIEDFVKKDKRVRGYSAKINSGTPYTFHNMGARVAKGEIISFLDDDSAYLPEHIEKLLSKIEEGFDAVYCYAKNIYINENREVTNTMIRGKPYEVNSYLWGNANCNFIDTSDIMLAKQAFLNVGGMKEDASYQDWALMAKLGIMRYKIGCVPEVLTEQLIHKNPSDFSPEDVADTKRKFYVF